MNYSIILMNSKNYLILFFLLCLIGVCCGSAASSQLGTFAIASNARLLSAFFEFDRSTTRSPPSFVTVSVFAFAVVVSVSAVHILVLVPTAIPVGIKKTQKNN